MAHEEPHGDVVDEPASPSADAAASTLKPKFAHLATRFVGFEEQLDERRRAKQDDIDRRFSAVHAQTDELREAIVLEKRNQANAMKALQSWLETQLVEWTSRVETPLHDKLDKLDKRLDFVLDRVAEVEHRFVEETAKFPKMVEERSAELLQQIRDFEQLFEAGQRAREEREAEILVKIVEQGDRLEEEFELERVARERRDAELAREIEAEVDIRAKADEIVRKRLAEQVAELKASIEKEVIVREEADEELVAAINHYGAALQDAIKVVSEQ